jgi:sugar phosphate isomerase/epimerase
MGDGELPLRQIVSTLLDSGYDGFFEIELMGEEIEARDYHELLAQSRSTYHDLLGAPRV